MSEGFEIIKLVELMHQKCQAMNSCNLFYCRVQSNNTAVKWEKDLVMRGLPTQHATLDINFSYLKVDIA